MKRTPCETYDGKNCKHWPSCSCEGFDRSVLFEDNPLCNDCETLDECGSLGCIRERKTDIMSVDCKTGGTCFLYPMCSCGYEDKARLMATRCEDCKTNDTCNVLGCIKPVNTVPYENVMDVQMDPCVNGRGNCKHLGVCGMTCIDRIERKVEAQIDCCNDPGDCSEPCNIVIGPSTCQLDEGCDHEGKVEECPRCTPELDGRNEGPVNQFGCSYVDCDCTSPCWEKSKTVNIVINGTMNGDINI